jgi:hypothetical protein
MFVHDRFARLAEISLQQHNVVADLDWRYPLLFEFLRVSPSYRLAHLIATGVLPRDEQPLPADFVEVEGTYRLFGPVYDLTFAKWWLTVGQFQFGISAATRPHAVLRIGQHEEVTQQQLDEAREGLERYATEQRVVEGQPASLVVAIPVSRDRQRMLRELAALIEREFGEEARGEQPVFARVLVNKIREHTLETALRVLFARSAQPKSRLFELGNQTDVAPAYWTDQDAKRRDDHEVNHKRRIMEIATSRQLQRAYLFAENAARGRFPSLEALPDDPNRPHFDYQQLADQHRFRAQARWNGVPTIARSVPVISTQRVKNALIITAQAISYRGVKMSNMTFELVPGQDLPMNKLVELEKDQDVKVRVFCSWHGISPPYTNFITVMVTGSFTVRRDKTAIVVRVIGGE